MIWLKHPRFFLVSFYAPGPFVTTALQPDWRKYLGYPYYRWSKVKLNLIMSLLLVSTSHKNAKLSQQSLNQEEQKTAIAHKCKLTTSLNSRCVCCVCVASSVQTTTIRQEPNLLLVLPCYILGSCELSRSKKERWPLRPLHPYPHIPPLMWVPLTQLELGAVPP